MKYLLSTLFLASMCMILLAQTDTRVSKFGLKAGVNYSLMNFNKAFFPPNPAVTNVWRTGFTAGALLKLPVSKRLILQPEYSFTQMNGEDPRIKTSYNINYLSLPLLLKITVLEKLSVIAGPQFDLLVSAKEKSSGISNSIEHQTEERGISGVVGLELDVLRSFFIDARYLNGFNHIGIQRSDVNEFKWASVTLAVGVHF